MLITLRYDMRIFARNMTMLRAALAVSPSRCVRRDALSAYRCCLRFYAIIALPCRRFDYAAAA